MVAPSSVALIGQPRIPGHIEQPGAGEHGRPLPWYWLLLALQDTQPHNAVVAHPNLPHLLQPLLCVYVCVFVRVYVCDYVNVSVRVFMQVNMRPSE